ncbi:stage II sporulation protein M [candidate division KSB1 bacterium]|nr:stage II sporulation protein M [candidate division KSB1 bacterium]
MYSQIWTSIDWYLVLLSAGIFLLGIVVAPWVLKNEINFLIRYPLWVFRTLSKYIDQERGILPLFILIFSLNVLSLSLDVLSGWGGVLPFLFAFLTGLNIALISFKIGGHSGILALLFNPVALLELPAAWLALSGGMQIGVNVLKFDYSELTLGVFRQVLDLFVFVVIPLLAISALLESILITLIRDESDENDDIEDDFDVW